MASTFIHSPDIVGNTAGISNFFDGGSGTVIYDSTTIRKSGNASYRFGDAVVDAPHSLRKANVLNAGFTRISLYIRLEQFNTVFLRSLTENGSSGWQLGTGIDGALQLVDNDGGNQLGADGPILQINTWYHIYFAYILNSVWNVWVDSVLAIHATAGGVADNNVIFYGVLEGLAGRFVNIQHFQIDDNNQANFGGDIRTCVKRPFSNGILNEFTTQIGAGGSGYGSGHAPQVNERPFSNSNGWSEVIVATSKTEEYTVEDVSSGDVDISGKTIIDIVSWIRASALSAETAQMIGCGKLINVSLTSTITFFLSILGLFSYSGGNDIGIKTTTLATTVSLYECGLMIAYSFSSPPRASIGQFDPELLIQGWF